MIRKHPWAMLVATSWTLATASPASASIYYAVGTGANDSSSDVYIVTDITNGTAEKLGEAGILLSDIAYQASTALLFGVDATSLYSINPSNGHATRIGLTGHKLEALEFCGDILYGWGEDSTLMSINVRTGSVTILGSVGYTAGGDLACAADGTLYGAAAGSPTDRLITINRLTGQGQPRGFFQYPNVEGLSFDVDGTLVAAANNTRVQFFTVDPATGTTVEELSLLSPPYGLTGSAIDQDDGTGCTLTEQPDTWYYVDADGDGYGTDSGEPGDSIYACTMPAGYAADETDCDDGDADVHPEGEEVCDGKDGDCDGTVDNDAIDALAWWVDQDGDGYGDGTPIYACEQPTGYAGTGDDCDDLNPDVHPNTDEVCNGLDDDCNRGVDDGLAFATWYADQDGDGYGSSSGAVSTCDGAPAGYVGQAGDCDDGNADAYPSAPELCDGADNDCDGAIDDELPFASWYMDADADGYGDPQAEVTTCDGPPPGYVGSSNDCNDGDEGVYPGAAEVCDGQDNDCDGAADDGLEFDTYYQDTDGDGYGNAFSSISTCDGPPPGYVAIQGDCVDVDAAIHPDTADACDQIDNDCDGQVDEDGAVAFYRDADGDSWGRFDTGPGDVFVGCVAPEGYVARSGDCDDDAPQTHPEADELCDGVDNDCDDEIDDDPIDPTTFYLDADGDGFGGSESSLVSCAPPVEYVAADGDCDDANDAVNPGAAELEDGLDNDCDGSVDEGLETPTPEPGDDDTTAGDDDTTAGDDDTTAGDDDTTSGDDDTTTGDDDTTTGDDDTTAGDDDTTTGDDDTPSSGDDDTTGDGNISGGCSCNQGPDRQRLPLGTAGFALIPLASMFRRRSAARTRH